MNFEIDCKKFLPTDSNLTSKVEFIISGNSTFISNNLLQIFYDIFDDLNRNFESKIKSKSNIQRINFCGSTFQYNKINDVKVDIYVEPILSKSLSKDKKKDFITHLSLDIYSKYIQNINPIHISFFNNDFEKVLEINKSSKLYFNNFEDFFQYNNASFTTFLTPALQNYFSKKSEIFFNEKTGMFEKSDSLFLIQNNNKNRIPNIIQQETLNIRNHLKDTRFFKQCFLHENLNKSHLDNVLKKYSVKHNQKYDSYVSQSFLNPTDKFKVLKYLDNESLNELFTLHCNIKHNTAPALRSSSSKP